MKRTNFILLLFAIIFAGLIIAYDYKHDYSPYPMTAGQYTFEIIVVGGLYTGIVYVFLYGVYRGIRSIVSK